MMEICKWQGRAQLTFNSIRNVNRNRSLFALDRTLFLKYFLKGWLQELIEL